MFGIGFSELLIILLFVLVFVKPKDIPKLLYEIGRVYGKFSQLFRNVKSEVYSYQRELEKKKHAVEKDIKEMTSSKILTDENFFNKSKIDDIVTQDKIEDKPEDNAQESEKKE